MNSQPYTNREIDQMQKEIHEKLDLILSQTTKTNGRVSRLEVWKGYITGGLAIITVLVLPMAFYALQILIERK